MAEFTRLSPGYTVTRNGDSWQSVGVQIKPVNTALEVPSMSIPDGFAVTIFALGSNSSNVMIGPSKAAAIDVNRAITLQPGQTFSLFVKNTNCIFVSGITVNDVLIFISEKFS